MSLPTSVVHPTFVVHSTTRVPLLKFIHIDGDHERLAKFDDQNMQIMHSIVDSSCCQENTLQFSLVDILHNLNLKHIKKKNST
jgi:hypothetical protein